MCFTSEAQDRIKGLDRSTGAQTMSRTAYRNGDEITLKQTGCDSCSPANINGILCHEAGCPDAWKDYIIECFQCGCEFYPIDKPYPGAMCLDCTDYESDEESAPEENTEVIG